MVKVIRLSTQTISFLVKLRSAKMRQHTLRLLQMGMIQITRVLIFLEVFGLEPAVLQTYSKTLWAVELLGEKKQQNISIRGWYVFSSFFIFQSVFKSICKVSLEFSYRIVHLKVSSLFSDFRHLTLHLHCVSIKQKQYMIRGFKVLFAEYDLSIMEPKIWPTLERFNDFTRYIN